MDNNSPCICVPFYVLCSVFIWGGPTSWGGGEGVIWYGHKICLTSSVIRFF